MAKKKYRSANIIILILLECILRAEKKQSYMKNGIIKSHLIKYAVLKKSTADEYLEKMEKANYIISHKDHWGEREITIIEITSKGRERYEWFAKINSELE